MKKIFATLVLVWFAVPVLAANVGPVDSGTISLSTGAASTALQLQAGQMYSLQCNGEVRIKTCPTSTCVADATNERVANFDWPYPVDMPAGHYYISLIRTGSLTITCYVYRYVAAGK